MGKGGNNSKVLIKTACDW